MDCEAVQQQLSAWIDGELDPGPATAVEAHLATCAECRAAADGCRVDDAALVRAFAPGRDAARNVEALVMARLAANNPAPARTAAPSVSWPVLIAATAAGFVAAVVIFRPWEAPAPTAAPPTVAQPPTTTPPLYAARLVVATGNVELQESSDDVWQVFPSAGILGCPSGSVIRTGPDVRCELETVKGDTLRLDTDTEMRLVEENAIQIERGRIWCRTADTSSLRVLGPEHGSPQGLQWVDGPAGSSMIVEVEPNRSVRVVSASGHVQLKTAADGETRLDRGQSADITGNKVEKSPDPTDLVLDSRWIHSILMRKGHGDAELNSRVDELMARIGQSKVSVLYEREVRVLGEYAVLPLLRYIQSPLSHDEPRRRRFAAEVLADMATSWAVGELVELLADTDPEVRYHVARALARLTGTGQGLDANGWRDAPPERRDASLARWRRWWSQNKSDYPPPDKLEDRFQ